jgi:uncharacterized FlgJ-related protein
MISRFILSAAVMSASLFTTSLNLGETKKSVNYQSLYEEIVKQGIEYPEIVWAQAVLESGNFDSDVFHKNNNLFGMRLPERRRTVADGAFHGYAKYGSWQESVEDYKLYQEYYFKDKKISKKSYFSHLNRSYCEIGGQYSTRVKSIISKMYDPKFKTPENLRDGIFGNESDD